MEANPKRILLAAEGYLELGMFEESWAELQALPDSERESPDHCQIRVHLLMKGERWAEALEMAQRLIEMRPNSSAGYIHSAYCLHELGKTEDARSLLEEGPPSLRNEPTYFYNLGCYEAILGNLEKATKLVKQSFQMEKRLEDIAKKDKDLECIWDDL